MSEKMDKDQSMEGAARALPLATPTAWINRNVWDHFARGETPDVICANRIHSPGWDLPLYGPEAMARAERQVARSEATLLGLLEALHHHTGLDHGMMAIRKLVERAETADKAAALAVATPTPVSHVMLKPAAYDHDITLQSVRASSANVDDADPRTVLLAVLGCVEKWVPGARVIGNVRAGDVSIAIRAALASEGSDNG